MEGKLYEKIGRQEVIIEALKRQSSELSGLIAKFISGEEKPEGWTINNGQLTRKATTPKSAATVAEVPKKK